MQTKRIGLLCLVCLFYTIVFSQSETNIQAADKNSMQLFKEQKWKELLQYGKEEIAQGVDFPLLRMRAGYAAFALGNYSESLKQYSNVYDKDKDNKIALYYVPG